MKKSITTLKASEVISMSEKTKLKLAAIADRLKGKELFADKIEIARKSLSDIQSLPI
jgi:hypothetical protein